MTTITIHRATVEQALEALEIGYEVAKGEADRYHTAMAGFRPESHAKIDAEVQQIAQAITALRAALAQPAPPPEARTEAELERLRADNAALRREAHAWWTAARDAMRDALGAQRKAQPAPEPVAWMLTDPQNPRLRYLEWDQQARPYRGEWIRTPLYTSPPQRKPLTIERLRDALVASRIVPPAAVEDPDDYDDGVTLHRIEALHRRIT